ncbi:hypothetical protein BU23DRAFT_550285 [Bimuria novae-zelandiae CBS 107.79]|uniref:UBC core domain-containing protein n=1 Tax=Bimuria novae-zelandiae CBS 107.79 TaxID=1447943 RepID=A0A6A5VRA5_9PLEO|nr:hypothetical protein BU23DRAFT_550285 [Bimuria novae-zelandiae CBS 107.79]
MEEEEDFALAMQLQWQEENLEQFDIEGMSAKDLEDYMENYLKTQPMTSVGVPDEIIKKLASSSNDETESGDGVDNDDHSFVAFEKGKKAGAKKQQTERHTSWEILEKEITQLCKDDGAAYADSTPAATQSRTFSSLASWMAHVRAAKCKACRNSYFNSPFDVIDIFKDWLDGTGGYLSSQLLCKHCKMFACPSCAMSVPDKISWLKVHGNKVSWCCDDGRLLILWVILCGFDNHYCASKTKTTAPSAPSAPSAAVGSFKRVKTSAEEVPNKEKKQKGKDTASGRSGVGFGGDDDLSAMYQQIRRRDRRGWDYSDDLNRARKTQMKEDTFGSMTLKFLTGLAPERSRGTAFDDNPPGAVSSMLFESCILGYCASLLRNDSLDELDTRRMVYTDLFKLVTVLCTHPNTAGLIYNDHLVRSDGRTLATTSFQLFAGPPGEQGESVAKSARNLATQSSLLLKHAHMKDFTGEGSSIIQAAQAINQLWQILQSQISNQPASPSAPKSVAIPDPTADVPTKEILASHAYASQARHLVDPPRGRMKRLLTEITALNTGLPPGIYVRYASERPDVMKAIIIGASGTPYEHGIFEFDIFCGLDYPYKPPQVTFKTTGKGTAHFNPNLYKCGKVCLSLLGTWQGEPWKPGESTLLQVLISIQAMVLCEEPWFNEPGRELAYARNGTKISASRNYNNDIRALTVEHAITAYATSPPALWRDVVDYHFKANADSILETVQGWANEINNITEKHADDPYQMYNIQRGGSSLRMQLSSLQEAMDKYGASVVLKVKAPPPQTAQQLPRRSRFCVDPLHYSPLGLGHLASSMFGPPHPLPIPTAMQNASYTPVPGPPQSLFSSLVSPYQQSSVLVSPNPQAMPPFGDHPVYTPASASQEPDPGLSGLPYGYPSGPTMPLRGGRGGYYSNYAAPQIGRGGCGSQTNTPAVPQSARGGGALGPQVRGGIFRGGRGGPSDRGARGGGQGRGSG